MNCDGVFCIRQYIYLIHFVFDLYVLFFRLSFIVVVVVEVMASSFFPNIEDRWDYFSSIFLFYFTIFDRMTKCSQKFFPKRHDKKWLQIIHCIYYQVCFVSLFFSFCTYLLISFSSRESCRVSGASSHPRWRLMFK